MFILSVANEYKTGDQVCSLLYDGGRIDPDKPLIETINQDIEPILD